MASRNQSSQKRNVAQSSKKSSSGKRNVSSKNKKPQGDGFIDDEAKRSIAGVLIIVLAVAMFIAALIQSDAVVTNFVSQALHLTFGIGAYICPFFLLCIGASFLIRSEREHVPGRVAVGLLIIFICLLGILSLFAPLSSSEDLSGLFTQTNLVSFGGYLGAGIAWVGLKLFGQIISVVILIGFIVVSIFIIGFSISSFMDKINEKREARQRAMDEDVLPAPKVMRGKPFGMTSAIAPQKETETAYIPKRKNRNRSGEENNASNSPITQVLNEERLANKRALEEVDKDAPVFMPLINTGAQNQVDDPEPEKPLTRKLGTKSSKADAADGAETKRTSRKAKKTTPAAGSNLGVPAPMEGFELPPMDILKRSKATGSSNASEEELQETAMRLQETIEDFGIMVEVAGWVAGPTVTLFKLSLPSGVRVSRITVLSDDIALALAAPGVRIFAPIPGTNYVGIEVPNAKRQPVLLGDVLDSAPAGPLQMAVGKDVEGNKVIVDLAKAPHVLIGGTTGSGKSVGINSFIVSMLMRNTPAEVRFILIDPKRVEFTLYNGIPHLYIPVVEDPKDASAALGWGVAEMERRLKVFSAAGARNITQYNTKVQSGELEGETPLPYIVIVIDELADLMMNVGKEVEFSISRIAQLARAAGIHLIVATQRPSANVVTGLIKSNITTRMAFTVASGTDSRVILDTTGAEKLTGYGDMLLSKPDLSKPVRIQGCFVTEDEINALVEHLKAQGEPEYHSEILQTNVFSMGDTAPDGSGGKSSNDDPLIWEAADIVVSAGTASTSYIQRRLSVGYSRAGRIMDNLEQKGIVGPSQGSKAREVLVDALELESLKTLEMND